jgi:hypothetical protein
MSGRPVAIILVHHENKGGKVSGAWEGVGDTLLHVQQQGHGRLRLYVQKARWASEQHATTLQLAWADGDGFDLAEQEPDRPERTWNDIGGYVREHGGCGWVEVERAVSGQADYLRRRRDQMLSAGELLNVGTAKNFALWHRDDPARPPLDLGVSEGGHTSDITVSATGDGGEAGGRVPVSPYKGDTGLGTRPGSTSPDDFESAVTTPRPLDEDIPS